MSLDNASEHQTILTTVSTENWLYIPTTARKRLRDHESLRQHATLLHRLCIPTACPANSSVTSLVLDNEYAMHT